MWCHIGTRVNAWEAFKMAETSPARVDAMAEKNMRDKEPEQLKTNMFGSFFFRWSIRFSDA
jgi:UDP-N-acetylenolpyruvoylglucosamine reductase